MTERILLRDETVRQWKCRAKKKGDGAEQKSMYLWPDSLPCLGGLMRETGLNQQQTVGFALQQTWKNWQQEEEQYREFKIPFTRWRFHLFKGD